MTVHLPTSCDPCPRIGDRTGVRGGEEDLGDPSGPTNGPVSLDPVILEAERDRPWSTSRQATRDRTSNPVDTYQTKHTKDRIFLQIFFAVYFPDLE